MGLWGVFIGPIVACCLHALVGIFNTELGRFSPETEGQSESPAESPAEPPEESPEEPTSGDG
jgi:hypothetical protein